MPAEARAPDATPPVAAAAASHLGGWDCQKYGVPINQEDIAVTLLAFSVNVLYGIELSLGRPLPAQEMADYLHLWRLIGWLMGLDEQINPCSHGVEHGKVSRAWARGGGDGGLCDFIFFIFFVFFFFGGGA